MYGLKLYFCCYCTIYYYCTSYYWHHDPIKVNGSELKQNTLHCDLFFYQISLLCDKNSRKYLNPTVYVYSKMPVYRFNEPLPIGLLFTKSCYISKLNMAHFHVNSYTSTCYSTFACLKLTLSWRSCLSLANLLIFPRSFTSCCSSAFISPFETNQSFLTFSIWVFRSSIPSSSPSTVFNNVSRSFETVLLIF